MQQHITIQCIHYLSWNPTRKHLINAHSLAMIENEIPYLSHIWKIKYIYTKQTFFKSRYSIYKYQRQSNQHWKDLYIDIWTQSNMNIISFINSISLGFKTTFCIVKKPTTTPTITTWKKWVILTQISWSSFLLEVHLQTKHTLIMQITIPNINLTSICWSTQACSSQQKWPTVNIWLDSKRTSMPIIFTMSDAYNIHYVRQRVQTLHKFLELVPSVQSILRTCEDITSSSYWNFSRWLLVHKSNWSTFLNMNYIISSRLSQSYHISWFKQRSGRNLPLDIQQWMWEMYNLINSLKSS